MDVIVALYNFEDSLSKLIVSTVSLTKLKWNIMIIYDLKPSFEFVTYDNLQKN